MIGEGEGERYEWSKVGVKSEGKVRVKLSQSWSS